MLRFGMRLVYYLRDNLKIIYSVVIKMKFDILKILTGKTNIMRSNTLFVLIIVFLTALIYSSAINNDFTNWDDNYYVTGNRLIKDFSKEGIKKLWTERTGMGGTRLTLTSFLSEIHATDSTCIGCMAKSAAVTNDIFLFFVSLRIRKYNSSAFKICHRTFSA
ncbi:hypothetical protein ES703_116635 [subsurface metagenome]